MKRLHIALIFALALWCLNCIKAECATSPPSLLGTWTGPAKVVTEKPTGNMLTVTMKLEITEQNAERFRGYITLPISLDPDGIRNLITGVIFDGNLHIIDDGWIYSARLDMFTSPPKIAGYWHQLKEDTPHATHSAVFSLTKTAP